ncbi:LPXTG cell wall anchor domain-containing protein [Streptococcus pneumoniae]
MNKTTKTMKAASIAAAIVTAAATANQTAFAEEVGNQPVVPTAAEAKAKADDTSKVTEAQVNDAKADVNTAQAEVTTAKTEQANAVAAEEKATEAVRTLEANIQTAEKADEIVKAQDQVVEAKTAEKEEADAQLATTKADATTAKADADQANEAKATAQAQHAAAQADVAKKQDTLDKTTDKAVQDQITATKSDIKAAEQTAQAKATAIADVDSQIASKQQALEAQPTTQKVTAYTSKGYKPQADKHAAETGMEKVDFQGAETIEVEITPAQYEEYQKTGKFTYQVDNHKLSEIFLQMLNRLRELNGLVGNLTVDNDWLAYAEARANEMKTNNVLSHDTNLTAPTIGHYYENGSQRGAFSIDNGTITYQDEIVTHEKLAYDLLYRWYSDYLNLTGKNYGHRRALMVTTGSKAAVAVSTAPNDDKPGFASYYAAYEADTTGANYKMIDDPDFGPSLEYVTPEDAMKGKEQDELEQTWDESDILNPKILGRHMVFLPDMTFKYVVNLPVDNNHDVIREEITTLNNKKAVLVSEKNTAEQTKTTLEAKLNNLNQQAADITAAHQAAQTALDEAKANLASTQRTLDTATAEANAKNAALKTATDKVNALTEQVNALSSEIQDATALRDKAIDTKANLDQLKADLTKAQAAKAKAVEDKATADVKVQEAEARLTEATDKYVRLVNLYNLQQALDNPKVDEPKVDEPKVDEPKVDEPKVDEPKVDEPKVDEPEVPQVVVPIENIKPIAEPQAKENPFAKTPKSQAGITVINTANGQTISYSRVARSKELPQTGTKGSLLALAGVAILSGLGLAGARRKRRG